MNEFVATVIGEVNAALKKKGWKKRGRAPSIEAIVEKTTELLRVATDKELAAAYGDDGMDHTGDFVWKSTIEGTSRSRLDFTLVKRAYISLAEMNSVAAVAAC